GEGAHRGAIDHPHLAFAQGGHERGVVRQHAEVALDPGGVDLVDLPGEHFALGRDEGKGQLTGHQFITPLAAAIAAWVCSSVPQNGQKRTAMSKNPGPLSVSTAATVKYSTPPSSRFMVLPSSKSSASRRSSQQAPNPVIRLRPPASGPSRPPPRWRRPCRRPPPEGGRTRRRRSP